ncbi:MAG: SAM-dependent methyltransferase [Deltaproteobacteria bacterium]|nr:SAM-dependent methyltransferase [Deltaproteobacteria bacterium]
MSERRIETKISRTAELMCLCRAISSLERNPYYRSEDQTALSLLPGFLNSLIRVPLFGRLLMKTLTAKGIYEYVIARTKYIDAVFRQALSDSFSQILLFGAGFDTRALRFQKEAHRTRIFELDVPPTLKAKLAQYQKRRLTIPPNVVFVPIDFDRESLPAKLDQAGFTNDDRTLFVLEGVLEYLQPRSVDQTFRTIHALAGAGSEVVFNYVYASVIRREDTYYGEEGAMETLAKVGELWHFGIEKGEIGQFLKRYGFELCDHWDARELEEMYFKDPAGKIVGRVHGTHCLVRAKKTEP